MPDALVTQLARALNLPPDAARHTLDHLVATLREQLDATGETRVPGLGTFYRDEEGLYFHPDDGLARAVNHRYAGLRPIEAGPSSSRPPRDEEPEEEAAPDDPFAETPLEELSPADEDIEGETPAEKPVEPDADLPETAVGFQPLQSFIEPEDSEGDAELEPEPPDAFEETGAGAPGPEPSVETPQPSEPLAEEEVFPSGDEPPSEEEPFEEAQPEEGRPEEERFPAAELPSEEEPPFEEAPDEEVAAGTWAEGPETPESEHVLGPLPSEEIEEAEYDVVEPDEPAAEPALEAPPDEAWEEGPVHADHLDEQALDEEAPRTEEAGHAPEPPAPPPTEPPLVSEEPAAEAPPPEPETEPVAEPAVEPHAATPAVGASSGAPDDREPVAPERRRGVPVFLTVVGLGLVLGVVALLWLLNREPDGPDLTERPVPADTAVVAEVPPPTDTLAAADTAAFAEATPLEANEPTAPTDPLRGAAGIDPAAGGFTWVVASELDRTVADQRVAEYREQGLRAGVVAQEAGGRTRYRVSLGQFDSVADAESRRADLPPDVPADSWILRL